jgi:hypothetical protein
LLLSIRHVQPLLILSQESLEQFQESLRHFKLLLVPLQSVLILFRGVLEQNQSLLVLVQLRMGVASSGSNSSRVSWNSFRVSWPRKIRP